MRLINRFFLRSKTTLFLLTNFAVPLALPTLVHAQPLPDRAPFSGRVVDTTGRPLGGAAILLRRQNEQGGVAYWGGVAASDARGNFSFPNAEAGLYYISIDAGGFKSIQDQSITLPLKADAPPFQMLELAIFRVKIKDAAGAPLLNANFAMVMRGVPGSADTYPRLVRGKTDAAGEVSFPGLIPGKFDLLGVVPGSGYIEAKNTEIAPGAMATPLDWQTSKGGTLDISAHEPSGKAIGGGVALFSRIGDPVPETPRATPGPEMQVYSPRPLFITRDGDGLFRVADLAPGRYSVSLSFRGLAQPLSQEVQVEAGATGTADFKFAPPAGMGVTAKVADAKGVPIADTEITFLLQQIAPATPAGGAIVPATTAVVTPIGAQQERRARTDAAGNVVLYPVPAATYQITARRVDGNPASSAPQTIEVKDGVAPLTFKMQ